MEASGKYDFIATEDEELSFRKGDLLKVSIWLDNEGMFSISSGLTRFVFAFEQIIKVEVDWCKAEMNGREGYVPHNYIDFQIPG